MSDFRSGQAQVRTAQERTAQERMAQDGTASDSLPLEGLLVLDLGQVYQGPYATFLMARAGATVIKIEPHAGEAIRQRAAISRGSAVPFAMLNAHKRSLTLDLKHPRGVEILKRLAEKADVLLENYAPGVMDRLGVGWAVLSEINPRLIYASGSGYGITGPDANNLAMDVTVQAASGMMSVTGFPDGPPVKAGPAVADFMSGAHLYAGIMTALFERTRTGRGRLVEVAMQEAVYPALASNLAVVVDHETPPPRTGNRHGALAAAPYNVYAARDGHVAIIAVTDGHWRNLAAAMGRPALAEDPRFAQKASRARHIDEVDALVGEWIGRHARDEAIELLKRGKVPCAPVRDLMEVTRDRHMHERGMLEWIDHPEFGRIVVHDAPIRLHGARRLAHEPSPRLGQHARAVLAEQLGLDEDALDSLERDGVISAGSAGSDDAGASGRRS